MRDDKPSNDELRELYIDQRLSIPQISDRLNIPKSTIYHWVLESGIERRSLSEGIAAHYDIDYSLVRELYRRGLTQPQIAKRLQISQSVVSRIVNGINRKKKEGA